MKDKLTQIETAQSYRRLQEENRDLKAQLKSAWDKLDADEASTVFAESLTSRSPVIPQWTRKPAKSGKHEAVPVLLASDFHLDEWVSKVETMGRNEYNRKIAEERIRRLFERTCVVTRDYIKGIQYPGIQVCFLGDIFSGNIHEELKNTNEDSLYASVHHWLGPVTAGLKMLADEFGKVSVVGVVGNHGRDTKKPISKGRAKDNIDWFFYKALEYGLREDKRFTWNIPESQKTQFEIYGTRFMASHGDEARGGSGIAGLLSPLMIAASKMSKNFQYDYWLIGHWHQLAHFKKIRVNGSLVGWNEYAAISNFEYEPPQQDLFLVTPEHGVTTSWPIFV